METLYVLTFFDHEVSGRNTTIIGVFSTKLKAKKAVTTEVRRLFDAKYAPIVEEDEEEGSYFLIQKFKKDVVED